MKCKLCGKVCFANDGQFGKAVSHCCKDEIDYTDYSQDKMQGCWADFPRMSLRDYFAAKAMQGVMSNKEFHLLTPSQVAEIAYSGADAMLEAREK